MKKEKRNKLLAVFLVMVMAILLLSGCGGKRAEKELHKVSIRYV